MKQRRLAQVRGYLGGLLAATITACASPLDAQIISRLPAAVPPAASEAVLPAASDSARSGTGDNLRGSPERLPEVGRSPEAVSTPPPAAAWPIGAQSGGSRMHDARLIDLPTALALADRINPEIGISRQAILESLARQQGARVLLLPTLSGGANYHDHNGNLQQSGGAIIRLSEQALYFGGGARAIGSSSPSVPAVTIFSHLGDAIFEPLAAQQQVQVRQFEAGATFNSVLLNVSTSYVELMAAEARLEVLLVSNRDAAEVVRVTTSFARVGQARQADADRVSTEAALIDSEVQRAREQQAVAAAELARLLNLDPSVRLQTVGGPIPILQLVDPRYPLAELLDVALRQRPELAARNSQVAESEIRYRQERTRVLLPTILIGFSAGSFGGGSSLVTPVFGNFAARTDFDAIAVWTAENLGAGNRASWRGRQAQTNEAIATRVRTLNRVRSEVAEAYAASEANRRAIDVAAKRLIEAEAGFTEEFNRIRGGEGLPIELLDNLTRLVSARQAIIDAIAAYDQAQFQLFVAIGQPPTLALPNAQALTAPGHK